jgi:hypothetical protein
VGLTAEGWCETPEKFYEMLNLEMFGRPPAELVVGKTNSEKSIPQL